MKKLIILLILLTIPMISLAEECNNSQITIKSIEEEKNRNSSAEEITPAKYIDKTINLNVKFQNVGDTMEYKILIKNDSENDFELNENNIKTNSDFMQYHIETKDDSKIIKAKSEKEVFLRVSYDKEISEDKFVNGTYQEEKIVNISLANEDNPKTKRNALIVIVIILLLIISIDVIIVKKLSPKKVLPTMIGIAMLPVAVNAICTYDIKIESKIVVEKENETGCVVEEVYGCCGIPEEEIHVETFEYPRNISWLEFETILKNKYYEKYAEEFNNTFRFITTEEVNCMLRKGSSRDSTCRNREFLEFENQIRNSKQGCYNFIKSCPC